MNDASGFSLGPKAGAHKSSVDLDVELAGIKLTSPVLVASGTFGYGTEYADVVGRSPTISHIHVPAIMVADVS